MSSGNQRLVYNTLERLVSNDPNRAQAFLAAAQQEAWRARYSDAAANWRLFPGLSSRVSTITAPLSGDVYSGLFVRPDAGTYLTVDEGLAMLVDPTSAGLDDSPYLFVQDPGLSAPGSLPFAANATPSTIRWDVVECQQSDVVLESDNRDVYNPATGLFAPVSVPKVRAARLTYRIRLGNPGTGFSGGVAGWLPLAVVAVRDGATSFAQCDFYDVRPLVFDRVLAQPLGPVGNEGYSPIKEAYFEASASFLINGFSESEFGGYLAGGALRTASIPASLGDFGSTATVTGGDLRALSFTSAANLSVMSGVDQAIMYVACLFPYVPGQVPLPRWARYSEAPVASLGRRVPVGPRGIPVCTTTPPGSNGLFNGIVFPAPMQMGAVTGAGCCLAAVEQFPVGVQVNRRYHHNRTFAIGVTPPAWKIAFSSSPSARVAKWDLAANAHYPINAKSLRCSFEFTYNGIGFPQSFKVTVRSQDSLGSALSSHYVMAINLDLGGTPGKFQIAEFDIPILTLNGSGSASDNPYPPAGPPPLTWSVTLDLETTVAPSTFPTAFLQIHGWEF